MRGPLSIIIPSLCINHVRLRNIANDPDMIFRLNHTGEVLKAAGTKTEPVLPVNMITTFTITVQPDAVPEGEIISCWISWPKGNHSRQSQPELINVSNVNYVIAPDSAIHRSIYMEESA
jgi:hypothetical protein